MRQLIFILTLFISHSTFGQTKVFTQDISNFYDAFDNVSKQLNKAEQLQIVQTLYVDKASDGLRDFIALGGGNTQKWLNYILFNKDYLIEMRPYLERVSTQIPVIQTKLTKIRQVYPSFKDGNIYFIIGCGLVGGSPNKQTNNLLIGAEVLVKKDAEWAVPTAIHEFIHIQQKDGNGHLLTQTINEGVAEFLSELFFEKDLANNGYAPHIEFGNKNEKKVWNRFKSEMFVIDRGYLGWLYGAKNFSGKEIQDLGYFIGYKTCKTFYDKTNDKSFAIKTLLELDLSSDENIRAFILNSGFLDSDDAEFVKISRFTDKKTEQKIKKVRYGYKIKGNDVIFEYKIPNVFLERYKGNIGSVSIAGSFNNWQTNQESFKMVKTTHYTYRLIVPKSILNLGTTQQFKFVINEDIWMQAPETAKNMDEKSKNLTLSDNE